MRTANKLTLGLGTLLAAGTATAAASAHTGAGVTVGIAAGMAHPVLGLDHLIAMLAVGLWAGQLGGRARVALPLACLGLVAVGMALAATLPALAFSELAILASLVAFGLLLAFEVRLSIGSAALVVGGFALFHGHAHGAEVPAAAGAIGYAVGVLSMTALLLAGGVALQGVVARASARAAGLLALLAGGRFAIVA